MERESLTKPFIRSSTKDRDAFWDYINIYDVDARNDNVDMPENIEENSLFHSLRLFNIDLWKSMKRKIMTSGKTGGYFDIKIKSGEIIIRVGRFLLVNAIIEVGEFNEFPAGHIHI